MVIMLNHDTNQHPPLYTEILAHEQEVDERIEELATKIISKFKGTNPLFICLLRGGMPFASRLMFAISKQDPYFHPELDYMTVSSYGDKQTASATPRIVMDLSHKTVTTDRPVIVLDDMIDKGGTYSFTKKHLENRGVDAVYLAVLVQRELGEARNFNADFYCFSVDSEDWLTGMGLDDSRLGLEANRWAPYVAIANGSN
jgi:hypoxanthine phosphoribosyltransferase